ncbi:hypothetical protein GOBAR_DD08184 [Gossypium barbadense]|nr:hypothetical protein GOBAR_DD08184 [Gossypium barbadense]
MATITESLERSLQNFSLNHERSNEGGAEEGIIGRSSTSGDNNNLPNTVSDTSLELNSHLSLPYHWEQCLDLKTGEIYYVNWRNGMKAKLSSESSPSSSRERGHYNNNSSSSNHQGVEKEKDNVLVVAGCKSCLMYFMVPKQVEDCPKCNEQLLHLDRSQTGFP